MGLKNFTRILVAIAMVVFSVDGNATPTCTMTDLTFQPGVPSQLVLPYTTNFYSFLFSTIGTSNFQCTGGVSGDTFYFTNGGGKTAATVQLPGTTGYNYFVQSGSSLSPKAGPGYGYVSMQSGQSCIISNYDSNNNPILIFTNSGNCVGSVSLGYSFYASNLAFTNNNATTAILTSNYSIDFGGSNTGWMHLIFCGNTAQSVTCAPNITALKSAAGQDVTVTRLTTAPCAPSGAQTVVLPNVSTTAFNGLGSTAGATYFSITYNCPTIPTNNGSSTTMSLNWLFKTLSYGSDTTPNNFSLIADSTVPAGQTGNTGVQIQMTTMDGTAITTGMTVYPTPVTSVGTYTYNFIARYVQSSSQVNAGPVGGLATYNATYQ
jgi:hypothetical protein